MKISVTVVTLVCEQTPLTTSHSLENAENSHRGHEGHKAKPNENILYLCDLSDLCVSCPPTLANIWPKQLRSYKNSILKSSKTWSICSRMSETAMAVCFSSALAAVQRTHPTPLTTFE